MKKPFKLDNWIRENLFDVAPMAIAVINPEFDIVYANRAFGMMFGAWQKRKCFAVYKDRDSICLDCKGGEAFKDGVSRVNEEVGYNKNGRLTRYIKHTIPVIDEEGDIPFLVEMATDITETEQIKKEHQLLFDQVPCSILLIDRNYRIARTNKRVTSSFGDLTGRHCYKALKGEEEKCSQCTSRLTFEDGKMHTGHHIWKSPSGKPIHYQVTTVPLITGENNEFDLVMEMAVDITQTLKLKDELKIAHSFMETMIATSIDGIITTDMEENVRIFNKAARNIFQIPDNMTVSQKELVDMLPPGFYDQVSAGPGHVFLPECEITTTNDEKIPVRITGTRIQGNGHKMGMAFSIQDIREIKALESGKLEAERLAAVGQTVAGLAHGVKNLITGLEGGMYMLNSGMKKSDTDRIFKGMEMLDRNIGRVSKFVREFLNFSKGREIKVQLNDPIEIAKEVVDLYSQKAASLDIDLLLEAEDEISPAHMDSASMHECLTNLVGNAIDACRLSEEEKKYHVLVKVFEKDDILFYEVVDDGCGMDYEVKRKVFTSFFTTKGLGGTGLGLLMTQKSIQEHGGKIELTSEPGQGTTFRIILPRKRLPKTVEEE